MKVFKTSIRPDHVVTRSISLSRIAPGAKQDALTSLNNHPAIQEASYDEFVGQLQVEYDAGQLDALELEKVVGDLGGEVPTSWYQRIIRRWQAIQDHNIGMSEKLDPDQQVHCHTIHQKAKRRHMGWRSWPGD